MKRNEKRDRAEQLFRAMGEIDDRLLEEALFDAPHKKQPLWNRVLLVAATLSLSVLLLLGGTLLGMRRGKDRLDESMTQDDRGDTESEMEEFVELLPADPPSYGSVQLAPDGNDGSFGFINESTGSNGSDGDTVTDRIFYPTDQLNMATFPATVDSASYVEFCELVQRGLSLGTLRQTYAKSLRAEAFLNAFSYGDVPPEAGETYGIGAQLVPCPWNSANVLLRATFQTKEAERLPSHLVFLVDVSSSGNAADRLALFQAGFSQLVPTLTAADRVSVVTYSGREEVILKGCAGDDSEQLLQAVASLSVCPAGNGKDALATSYALAEQYEIEGGNNRVILVTDGDLNFGFSSAETLKKTVEDRRESGIYLSVLSMGGSDSDAKSMQTLAAYGGGGYFAIYGAEDAKQVFAASLTSSLYCIAEDARLRIQLDEKYVKAYRTVGYQVRVADVEIWDPTKRNGTDVRAGEQITLCLELELTEQALSATDAWLTLSALYRVPGHDVLAAQSRKVGRADWQEEPDGEMQFLGAVIWYTRCLTGAEIDPEALLEILATLALLDLSDSPDRAEFYGLVQKTLQNSK
ncbi:MAG: von Willebrand factor type A domain-containing protein [Clostridia bacterium]|nr:von Willebrand factor type A domain-containing protein [Clostridia bacterium]